MLISYEKMEKDIKNYENLDENKKNNLFNTLTRMVIENNTDEHIKRRILKLYFYKLQHMEKK